jgi:hypothetical protein
MPFFYKIALERLIYWCLFKAILWAVLKPAIIKTKLMPINYRKEIRLIIQ